MKKLKSLKGVSDDQVRDMIARDLDALEATDEQLAQARSFTEAFPVLSAKMMDGIVRRPVGRPKGSAKKTAVSLRLDQDVLEKFKSTGPGWQGRINEALRRA